jgi:hypothetical protein
MGRDYAAAGEVSDGRRSWGLCRRDRTWMRRCPQFPEDGGRSRGCAPNGLSECLPLSVLSLDLLHFRLRCDRLNFLQSIHAVAIR